MKSLFPVFISALLMSNFAILGQNNKTVVLKTNPIISLFSMWNIQADFSIHSHRSLQFSLLYVNDSYIFVDTEATGTIYTFDYKLYFKQKRRSSSYISPFLRYQHMVYEGNDDKVKLSTPGTGVMIGRQWMIFKSMVFDLHGGASYFPENYKLITTDGPVDIIIPKTLRGLGPRLGFLIGVKL